MKAIVYTEYGPPEVLHLKELDQPLPKDNEIQIKVHAVSINYGDLLARNIKNTSLSEFNMLGLFFLIAKLDFGLKKPKRQILGSEFSGEVVVIGKDVKQFKVGDPVFGYRGQLMGTYAEYFCMPENGCVTIKPANMSFPEAAAIPMGAIMALHLLKEKGNIQPGQRVLINGASGSLGSIAVQLAKNYFGAEVTGVCGTPRLEYVKSLGADKVIDYRTTDFTKNGETYHLIFDILGKSRFSKIKGALTKNGRYLLASFKMKQLLQMLWTKIRGGKKVICALAPGSLKDLKSVKELIEDGKIKTIIDKTFPMEKAAEAHRYVEEGNKKGNVVITFEHSSRI
ncbi:MAG: NAD(P)-dependent alcohol dehydrogenase [Bacteroidales bacterium]|nr:NAD(P)-dependent alcohol dehydrogenase [Bacteroidales bacterium]